MCYLSDFSEDDILGGRLKIRQPLKGYRAAIDPILLAASVPVQASQTILDVGSGVGTASLSLTKRYSDCHVTALEIQPQLAQFAHENFIANHMIERAEIITKSLIDYIKLKPIKLYDHVMTNPPYLLSNQGTLSPLRQKEIANREDTVSLHEWIKACLSVLRHKGYFVIIHRADRLDDLIVSLTGKVGAIEIFPLWPKKDRQANRVIIRCRKGSSTPLTLHHGLILHQEDGRYREEADAVLRQAQALF
jgi:tRNA1(Val) A37 N6-methylase TrmN6